MNDIMTTRPSSPPFYEAKDSAYGPMTPLVQQFFASLTRLPLQAWIGVSAPKEGWAKGEGLAERSVDGRASAARAKLRRVLDEMPAALARAKRRVHDIADCAAGLTAESVRAPMTRAALTAVLALIARPHLTTSEFWQLYGPFERLIPLERLEAAARSTPGVHLPA